MPSLTSIASSSLLTYKSALETVGNNIANVHTEGYSRQTVTLAPLQSENVGNGYIGNGVGISAIERKSNDFVTRLMHENFSNYNEQDAFYNRAIVFDNLFAQEGSDVSENLHLFFASLEEANQSADSLPARHAFMAQADYIADQFNNTQNIINESNSSLKKQYLNVAEHMTSLAKGVAEINSAVTGGNVSPELLDKRDNLILQISKYMDVQTHEQSDGAINVTIGRGEALVIGNQGSQMLVGVDINTGKTALSLKVGSNTHDITRNVAGGTIQGMVDYEENVLKEASRQMGLLAISLAENFNNQNKLGIDFNNNLGRDIFTDYNSSQLQVQRSTTNENNVNANLELSVKISDANQLQNSDYQLHMTGALTATLTRDSDNEIFNLTFTNTPTATNAAVPQIASVNGNGAITSVDGLELNFAGPPAAQDRFTISPTLDMAGSLKLLQTSGEALALASPVRAHSSSNNNSSGDISINAITATDLLTAPDLKEQFEIRILDSTIVGNDFQYEIIKMSDNTVTGPLNADFGDSINMPNAGYSVTIDGPVTTADVFITEHNSAGAGHNSNGLLLASLQTDKLLNDGKETLFNRYANLISNIGTQVFQSDVRREAADVLFQQAESLKLSEVGVNLDEEAATLVALQQSYQASAQLIKASKEMMNIIFSMLS